MRRLALTAVLLCLVAAPAAAQTPMEDPLSARDAKRVDRMEKVVRELRDIVFKGQKTGAPVVVQPADTDARLLEISNRLGDLEQSLTRINAALETTGHELELAKRDNVALKSQVAGLTEKLAAAEQKLAEAQKPPEPPPEEAPSPKPPTAQEAFASARQLQQAGDQAGAEAAYAAFLEEFGDTPRAAEASYQLGKVRSARGRHAQAATAYIGAIRDWPKTSWAPDAVVELSRSLIALKRPADACQTLAELPKRYPKAPAAVTAKAATAKTQAKCS